MTPLYYAVIGYLVVILISRLLTERASRNLSPEHKQGLLDYFRNLRVYNIVVLIIIIMIFVALNTKAVLSFQMISIIYIASIVSIALVFSYLNYALLKKYRYPQEFIATYLIARLMTLLSMGVLLLFILRDRMQ